MNEVCNVLMMIHHRLIIEVQHWKGGKWQETSGFRVHRLNLLQACVSYGSLCMMSVAIPQRKEITSQCKCTLHPNRGNVALAAFALGTHLGDLALPKRDTSTVGYVQLVISN